MTFKNMQTQFSPVYFFIRSLYNETNKETVRITERDRMQSILFYSLRLILLCLDEPIIDYGVMFNVHIVMSVWHVVYWQTLLTFPICNRKKFQLSKSQNEIKFCNTFVAVLGFASHCCTGNANCMDSSQRNCTEWRQSDGWITTILYERFIGKVSLFQKTTARLKLVIHPNRHVNSTF